MTTMSNFQMRDELALETREKSGVRGKVAAFEDSPSTIARAEAIYAQTHAQLRLLAAVCFFLSAALAIGAPERSVGFMAVCLGMAAVISASSKWMALRDYRLELEQAARAQGLSESEAQRAAASMVAARASQASAEVEAA
ncbi:hypothetical protein [Polyangium aurulentum]|uniref:hypothetical protein n=1 Tax=Polyangium aurulentum TaxID=2567896 RepID=UPI0010AE7FD7|nr:hypothetical protein [Polyangium aurulentum]UQA58685.1 hypothetical protein E8A73_046875 [Polyangium aurulentum]